MWQLTIPVLLLYLVIGSCNTNTKQNTEKVSVDSSTLYYCPMHPEIVKLSPGICPKPVCKGMELIKKVNDKGMAEVLNPVNSNVLSSIKTVHPKEMELATDINSQGYIDFDNRTKHNVASKYNGRIEKLYIKNNFQLVKKGDRLFDIYSPELITLQQNLIYLLSGNGSEELINGTKLKLKLLGFTDGQTDALVKTKKVLQVVPVFSKYNGHVHEAPDTRQTNMSMQSRQQTAELSVKEGMYVEKGKGIFNIFDPSDLVVILKINATDVAEIWVGQEVKYTVNEVSDSVLRGKINFIEPFYQQGGKTLLVRVNMNNHEQHHKAGSLVKAIIKGKKTEGLWIPENAVLNLGINKMVWLKKGGGFVSHKIEIGVTSNDWIEVYDGLTKRDEIAAEAHYLNDSESIIKMDSDK